MPVETFRSSTFTVHTRDAPRQSFSCDSLGGKRGNDSIPKLKFQRVKKSAANTGGRRISRDRVSPGRAETSLVTPPKSGRSTVDRPGRYSFSEGRVTGHVPLVRPLSIGSDEAGWFSRVRGARRRHWPTYARARNTQWQSGDRFDAVNATLWGADCSLVHSWRSSKQGINSAGTRSVTSFWGSGNGSAWTPHITADHYRSSNPNPSPNPNHNPNPNPNPNLNRSSGRSFRILQRNVTVGHHSSWQLQVCI